MVTKQTMIKIYKNSEYSAKSPLWGIGLVVVRDFKFHKEEYQCIGKNSINDTNFIQRHDGRCG